MTDKLTRILYVEDDADIQMVARLALETLDDYTVKACSSSDKALTRAPVFQPQLALLDVMMPGMDGPTTFKKLRELPQTTTTPVVFMTVKVQRDEVARYKKLGAVDVIAKPFDPMALASQIEKIWARCHA